MSPYRLSFPTAALHRLVFAAAISTVAVIKLVYGLPTSKKTISLKVKLPDTIHSSRALICSVRKVWPSATAIAIGFHSLGHRGPKLIEWYKDGIIEQDIAVRGVLEHSVAVEKHLNEEYFRHMPRSMAAPLHLDFGVEPHIIQRIPRVVKHVEIDYGDITLDDLKALVRNKLKSCGTRSHRLLLTQYAHGYEPCGHRSHQLRITQFEHCDIEPWPTLWNFPDPYATGEDIFDEHAPYIKDVLDACSSTNYAPALAICHGIAQYLTTQTQSAALTPHLAQGMLSANMVVELVGALARDAIAVDSTIMLDKFDIAPPGHEKHIKWMTDIAPYHEPDYKQKRWLRKNAPRWIRIPDERYGEVPYQNRGLMEPVPKNMLWESYDVNGERHDACLPLKQVLAQFASTQIRVARDCIELVKNGKSKYPNEHNDLPEAPDYFSHHEFDAALLYEWKTRNIKKDGMTYKDIQIWIGQGSEDSLVYMYQREVGKKYWKANPAQKKFWCDNDMQEFRNVVLSDLSANVATLEEDHQRRKMKTGKKEISAREAAVLKDDKSRTFWLKPAPVFEDWVINRPVRQRRMDSLSAASKRSSSGGAQSGDDGEADAASIIRPPPGLAFDAQQNANNLLACENVAVDDEWYTRPASLSPTLVAWLKSTCIDDTPAAFRTIYTHNDQHDEDSILVDTYAFVPYKQHQPWGREQLTCMDNTPLTLTRNQYAHWAATHHNRGPPPGLSVPGFSVNLQNLDDYNIPVNGPTAAEDMAKAQDQYAQWAATHQHHGPPPGLPASSSTAASPEPSNTLVSIKDLTVDDPRVSLVLDQYTRSAALHQHHGPPAPALSPTSPEPYTTIVCAYGLVSAKDMDVAHDQYAEYCLDNPYMVPAPGMSVERKKDNLDALAKLFPEREGKNGV